MIPVLFTTFNRLAYTKQTLPVLIKNTPDAEIIVIDNGSTDGTVDYLLEQKGISQLILNAENTGLSGAMNAFFKITEGSKIVGKVDNDTLVPPNWLDDLLDILVRSNLEIVQAKHFFHSTLHKDWDDMVSRRPVKRFSNGNVVYAKFVGGSGVVFKRGIITEPLKDNGLYGWGDFQRLNRQHRRGIFDGVWIDLLDMAGYNQYTEDIDMQYFLSTGRFEVRG